MSSLQFFLSSSLVAGAHTIKCGVSGVQTTAPA